MSGRRSGIGSRADVAGVGGFGVGPPGAQRASSSLPSVSPIASLIAVSPLGVTAITRTSYVPASKPSAVSEQFDMHPAWSGRASVTMSSRSPSADLADRST